MTDLDIQREDLELFGRTLQEARIKMDKSLQKIAEDLGLGASAVHNWENAKAFPSEDKLPIIAETYHLDLADLQKKHETSKSARANEVDANIESNRSQRSVNPYAPSEQGKFSRVRPHWPFDHNNHNR